jgi:hypothetical protein
VREEIMSFVKEYPGALSRPVSAPGVPFSTPRAWASLSRALDLVEKAGILDDQMAQALVEGRVSPQDIGLFCEWRNASDVPDTTQVA